MAIINNFCSYELNHNIKAEIKGLNDIILQAFSIFQIIHLGLFVQYLKILSSLFY